MSAGWTCTGVPRFVEADRQTGDVFRDGMLRTRRLRETSVVPAYGVVERPPIDVRFKPRPDSHRSEEYARSE